MLGVLGRCGEIFRDMIGCWLMVRFREGKGRMDGLGVVECCAVHCIMRELLCMNRKCSVVIVVVVAAVFFTAH